MKLEVIFLFTTCLLPYISAKPTKGSTTEALKSSEENFNRQKTKLEEKIKQQEEKLKEIKDKLKEKEEKRRSLLIKRGKIKTPFWLDAVDDPDYFVRTQPPNSEERRNYSIDQAAQMLLKDEVYNEWDRFSSEEKNGTMPTEHMSWPDESKELTFFEKYYSWKPTKFPTTPDPTFDAIIHPFDNYLHPDYQNLDIAYNKYYRYNSDEIAHYNKKYGLTLTKDMFTPPQPFVTGTNLSDWYNYKNNSGIAKAFYYPLEYNTLKANYMKYVFTPIPNTTAYPGQDLLLTRILENVHLPNLKDHLKNSTWCFICGDTFSHARDRMTHVTEKHYQYGDYGQDRLSDPKWKWKEDIRIYRRPTLLPEYYEEYVNNDHLTMDISFNHYEYWDAKRKAGEINFPNRPDCETTTLTGRAKFNAIRHELRHFIWRPSLENKH